MRYRANLVVVAACCGLAGLALGWGWWGPGDPEADTAPHVAAFIIGAIGLLLALPALASSIALNARARATRAAPEDCWSAGPAAIAELLDWQRRSGTDNEWRPTASERRRGVEICWAGEHLVVGGHYWRVIPGQYPRILSVWSRAAPPASVTLRYQHVWAHNMSSVPRFIGTEREFRFPAPDDAKARALVRHFSGVLEREDRSRRQRRLGRLANWALGAGSCFLALLVFGFGVAWHDQAHAVFRPTPERVLLIAATSLGVMGAPLLLWVGWLLRRASRAR